MTWEIIFICALMLLGILSFILEKIPSDVTALSLFSILIGFSVGTSSPNLPTVQQYLSVFSNPAPITIGAMFIISAALEKCGLIEQIAIALNKLSKLKPWIFILILLLTVAGLSAFVNNTAIVVILLPVILSLAHNTNKPASKLLIPISYASIFGGCCTAIGTSTNILLSGILTSHDMPPLSMFELGAIGFPLMIVGIIYLLLFSEKLLPSRETITSILAPEERKEFITEAFVRPSSSLSGCLYSSSELYKTKGIRLIEIVRQGVSIDSELNKIVLQDSDRLILACRPTAIMKARELDGIHFNEDLEKVLEPISSMEGSIIEGVIGPGSNLIGYSPSEVNFRKKYRSLLIAVHRKGTNVKDQLKNIKFQFGDTLLLVASENAIDQLRNSRDLLLLDPKGIPTTNMQKKVPIVLGIIISMILSVSMNLIPIVGASILAVTLLFLTGCLKPKEGYNSIEWRILVLIYGMLTLGLAMETTGFAHYFSEHIVSISNTYTPENLRPYIMLGAIYLSTAILTEFLTNNATVVLMTPLAIGLAITLNVDPRPFAVATCIGSSASFSTPIGYQTNTYVYGVGGYKFTDFIKIGLPLNILFFVACTLFIPLIWPF